MHEIECSITFQSCVANLLLTSGPHIYYQQIQKLLQPNTAPLKFIAVTHRHKKKMELGILGKGRGRGKKCVE
jgi:hypothetical protein